MMAQKQWVRIVCDVEQDYNWARKLEQALQERGFSGVYLGFDRGDSDAVAVVWLLNRKHLVDSSFDTTTLGADDEVLAWVKGPPLRPTDPVLHSAARRKGPEGIDPEAWNAFVDKVALELLTRAGISPAGAGARSETSVDQVEQPEPSRGDAAGGTATSQQDADSWLSEPSFDDSANSARQGVTGIFLCYRRLHAEGYAGRIFDRLTSEFPSTRLFMDVDNIQPGEDFVEIIERAITECRVMLVFITRDWAGLSDPGGMKLLEKPTDFVRVEITRALQQNLVLIPVLVGGAAMPRTEDLPESLAPLTRRQAIEIRHASWRDDVTKLTKVLQRLLAIHGR